MSPVPKTHHHLLVQASSHRSEPVSELSTSDYFPSSPVDYRPYHVLCDGEIVAKSRAWWQLSKDSMIKHSFHRGVSSAGDLESVIDGRNALRKSFEKASNRGSTDSDGHGSVDAKLLGTLPNVDYQEL